MRAREDSRWRMLLPPVPDRVLLGGWIYLRWAADLTMQPLSAGQLIRRLARGRAGQGLASDPATFLALGTLPSWNLERPKDWDMLDTTLDKIISTVGGSA